MLRMNLAGAETMYRQ